MYWHGVLHKFSRNLPPRNYPFRAPRFCAPEELMIRLHPSFLTAALALVACRGSTGTEPPGPPAGLAVVSTVPAAAPAGAPLPDSVAVKVTDAEGRGVPGVTVRWTVTAGSGSVRPVETPTGPEGVARTAWTMGLHAGEQRLTASIATATGAAAQTVATVASGSPNALQFDGGDDYVQVADAPSLDFGTGDFTWEVWLKRSRASGREDVLTKKDVLADSEHDLALLIESDGRANAFLRSSPFGTTVIVGSKTRIGSEWTHVAMTRSAGTVRLYVNGALEGSASAPVDVSSTGPLRIGANRINNAGADAPPVFPFGGLIHQVRIWNTARTGQQVVEGMLECFPRGTAGLVADLRFDEGTGTTVRDVSGNGNSGVLQNAPAWVVAPSRCPAS